MRIIIKVRSCNLLDRLNCVIQKLPDNERATKGYKSLLEDRVTDTDSKAVSGLNLYPTADSLTHYRNPDIV